MRAAFFYRHFPRLSFLARKLERCNYEPEMELLDVLCDPARTSIDVGAKMGMYTYRILARSADVVAFEPIPHYGHMLRTVFRRRPCRIEGVALSDQAGEAVLRMPFDSGGAAKFGRSTIESQNPLEHEQVASVEEVVVETRALDDYELDAVGFVKIDVEGHELAVLRGGARTIAEHRPNLLVEANDDHFPGAVPRLAEWLRGCDYRGVFAAGGKLVDIEDFDPERHAGFENFICFHRSSDEVHARLSERVASSQ